MRSDPQIIATIVALYRQGLKLREIGVAVDRDKSWVSKVLRREGMPDRRVIYKPDVIALRLQGKSRDEVAEQLGIKRKTVKDICHPVGL